MRACLTILLCSVTVALSAQTGTPLITSQDLLDGLKDSTRWLTYGGDYSSQRHSPLTQITPENVNQLTAQWTFQTGTTGSFQTTPLVVDGVLYVTGYNNNAWAVDARSGRQIWRYRRELPEDWKGCCGAVNRGFGVLGDRLYMTTIDAHLLALDMRTGGVLFDVELVDYKTGYSATVAPLVVKDKVIVGVAGAEYGIRGFIDAYDAQTGKRAWRFYTVAKPGEPGGQTWPRAGLLQRRSRRRQPVHGVPRGTQRRHRSAGLALSVHAARRARLGFDAGAGPRGFDDQRPATEGPDVRQPQRLLLHARSRHRKGHHRQALRRDDLGQRNRLRRPAGDAPGASA